MFLIPQSPLVVGNMKYFKNPISIRGDCLYCPLPIALDSYWNCLVDCHHCYFRRLNHTWGQELRPAKPSEVRKKLINGLKNKDPKSSLAWALRLKKTIRIGNKTDPLQPVEDEYKITKKYIRIFTELEWSFVIQTRFTERLMKYEKLILSAADKNLITLLPIMSPGLSKDWSVLERGRTTHPKDRLKHAKYFSDKGVPVGFNGEPFIPGYHEIKDFERTVKLLKSFGINRYNTYNFHFNAFVAKRLHNIGIDIEKIWWNNQDKQWKPILQKLLDIAKKHDIILGCPDFVNSGKDWLERANTCCGIDVPNPCTYNSHFWKGMLQGGLSVDEIEQITWDGIGDKEDGHRVLSGKASGFYTMKDAGLL